MEIPEQTKKYLLNKLKSAIAFIISIPFFYISVRLTIASEPTTLPSNLFEELFPITYGQIMAMGIGAIGCVFLVSASCYWFNHEPFWFKNKKQENKDREIALGR